MTESTGGDIVRVEGDGGQRGLADLILKDENRSTEADDEDVKGEQDAQPEMNLEERPAQPELTWMMEKCCEHALPKALPGERTMKIESWKRMAGGVKLRTNRRSFDCAALRSG